MKIIECLFALVNTLLLLFYHVMIVVLTTIVLTTIVLTTIEITNVMIL